MQQLLDIFSESPPSFDRFIVGDNGDILHILQNDAENPLYLLGESGTGKTYLAQAWVNKHKNQAVYINFADNKSTNIFRLPENIKYVAYDNIHLCSEEQQAFLFTQFNENRAQGVYMLFTADVPPVNLPLREDLRTRMGWCAVHKLAALSDENKIIALRLWAQTQQIHIDDTIFSYLLRYYSRDLGKLSGCLKNFDRYSLSSGRRMTVPLLQQFLQENKP